MVDISGDKIQMFNNTSFYIKIDISLLLAKKIEYLG